MVLVKLHLKPLLHII